MRTNAGTIMVLLTLGMLASGAALAEGTWTIKNAAQAAIDIGNGTIIPVGTNGLSTTMQGQFTASPVGLQKLSPAPAPPGSLIISSRPASTPGSVSGGIDYTRDPDLTHTAIDIQFEYPHLFGAAGPYGIQDIGIELGDSTGHIAVWTWNTAALTPGTQDFSFSYAARGSVPGLSSYFDNGLNLTQVVQQQISYDGLLTPAYPTDPTNNQGLWITIDHIVVTPEPDPAIALMLGTVGILGWAQCKRRRNFRLKKMSA